MTHDLESRRRYAAAMTELPNQQVFRTGSGDQFAAMRSDWLDSFAKLELAAWKCLDLLSGTPQPADWSMAQRLQKLRSLAPGPHLSKDAAAEAMKLADRVQPVLKLRAMIVHASMTTGVHNGEPAAFFQNVKDAAGGMPVFLILNAKLLRDTRQWLDDLVASMDGLQPKPGASRT